MNKTTIIVGSVTQAFKLRRLLAKAGIGSRVIKVDNTEDKVGCSHGVEISYSDFYQAVVILRENNIDYRINK